MGEKAGKVARRILAIAMGAKTVREDVKGFVSIQHKVTWMDDDGNVLDVTNVKHGSFPEHDDPPAKKSKGKCDYIFADWTPPRKEVTKDVTYRARYLELNRASKPIVFDFYNHVWDLNSKFVTYYTDNYFKTPSTGYDPSLTTFALALALSTGRQTFDSTENADFVKALLKDIGCDEIHINDYFLSGKKHVANIGVAIGVKNIDKPTVFLVIKGSDYGAEFGGNLIIGTHLEARGAHKGFSVAKERVLNFLKETLSGMGLSGDIRMLVTGYSRGGAVTNLVSTEITDMIDNGTIEDELGVRMSKNDMYGFCFEPALCQNRANPTDGRYDNIVCIIDPNDPVPKIPPTLYGFKVFGRICYLDSNNPDVVRRMLAYMDKYFGEGTSSYYNVVNYEPVLGNKTLGDMIDHIMTLSVKSFGNRDFYVKNVQEDIAYTVYTIEDNITEIKKVMSTYDTSKFSIPDLAANLFARKDIAEMVPNADDYDLLKSADTKRMKSVAGQVFSLIKRFDRKDLRTVSQLLRSNFKLVITPHYPMGPLSFLLADDPNYRL